ncbi:hypothetical protein PC9H_007133 [Pleurotus ostreatus]|uniref:Uncharacterized protein n=1 Tax=Pleurotus ostreatus TaxID=5322 RepID=A0A8H6ZTD2_PLEOS|nr:uncharacterized protein PC9H_007133 [Pleurotus ostreatus]KAF7427916.1 hypothetical protein PC9H_007133 [Pleurotus ostreatus]KAJ8695939.1 hypothetical protein PTI98_005846 [Pleurotus ostreatus]
MHVSKLAPAAAVLAALSGVEAGPTALSSVEASSTALSGVKASSTALSSVEASSTTLSSVKASSTATALSRVEADPIAYGLCQTGCNAVAVSCYAAAGFTFGTVIATPEAPAAVLACNAALGACSATCATGLVAPTS